MQYTAPCLRTTLVWLQYRPPVATTGILLLCCQDLPGAGGLWSTLLHVNGGDEKPEVGKGWCRLSIKLLSTKCWRVVMQTSSGEYMSSYLLKLWGNRWTSQAASTKMRWECTIMEKIFGSLNLLSSFSSLKHRDPMRKDCGCSVCHPTGSLAQVHNWRLNPITLLCNLID